MPAARSYEGPHSFQTTRWSLVRSIRDDDESVAMVALEQLCNSYWYPIYAFIRRSGRSPHDAEDLTQGFFAYLLDKDTLNSADPEKGKLRTFLLTCVRRFLGDQWDKAMAEKRGARLMVNFDPDWAEGRYAAEPVDDLTPDRLFQRRWALTVLEFSLQVLSEEHAANGRGGLFEALRPFLGFKTFPEQRYEAVAASLGIPLGTVKSHVSRMRDRWRALLFEQVAVTLDDPSPENIRGELAELMGCI
jgi:DNA-directed RNA polymerase specialized sigma24 family protein